MSNEATFPAFYDPAKVGDLYEPDMQRAYEEGLKVFQRAASEDKPRILLWLIDVQVDFVFPAPIGRLPVPNALDDTQRTVEWIYRNAQQITQIAASLDTHTPFQIFYPSWWENASGQHPLPFTTITLADVQKGLW